ncbi:MAG: hypothetical protein Q9208_007841 [Pyrenodesmia sp. 3 TL-2023]
MRFSTLFTPLLLALPVFSIDILLPLYLYPGQDASAWSDIFSTISTHPDANFQVIVNPNSGPGTSSFPTDTNYIAGIAKLNSYPNVQTVSYVYTLYGNRDAALVKADIDVYASWASYDGGADIAIGGIFFDEVSSEPTGEIYDYYAALAAHARTKIPAGKVVFNPGYRAPVQLFEYCDTMVEFEGSLASYTSEDILGQIPEGFEAKSAVIVHTTPPEGTDVGALIGEMVQKGLGAVYFGEDCCYKVFNKGLLEQMADSV